MAAPMKLVHFHGLKCLKNSNYLGIINRKTSLGHSYNQSESRRHYGSNVLTGETVRIGCASGFWGDSAVAAPQLIHGGSLDFLVFDYLAEITMSLLTAAKNKVPELGYAPDFVHTGIGPYINDIKRKGIRVVSNAGGVNPSACAAALQGAIKKAGVELNVAVVTGDDLMSRKDEMTSAVTEMESGIAFPKTVNSMNAYLGAGPIARALDLGADIVITGRCTDSAVTLGSLIHKFKWSMEDFDKMAAGSLAGHMIECGLQCTGGISTDWHQIPDWDNMGFPIVECDSSGGFILSKPPKTGGLVSKSSAAEQVLYEIGNPHQYILPDVVADFADVNIQELQDYDGGAVYVSGAKGVKPTQYYKVSATYLDGYRSTAVACLGGPKSAEKARITGEAIVKRVRRIYKQLGLADFSRVNLQTLGSEQTYGAQATPGDGPREAVLWLAVQHEQKKALELFAREVAPAGTGMAPGIMGLAGGRPKVSPVLKLFSYLYPKKNMNIDIHMNGEHVEQYEAPDIPTAELADDSEHQQVASISHLPSGSNTYRLEDLAYTRSGDKGNHSNIGVIARDPAYLPYIQSALTAEAVDQYMAHVFEDRSGPLSSRVKRYPLPGLEAFNFMLYNSLGGGGVASLRSDPQGKAFGQMLLDFKIDNMPDLQSIKTS